jgi:hypothetical protein
VRGSPGRDRLGPIDALVARIHTETGRRVPDVAEEGPGVDARLVVMLTEPTGWTPEQTGVLSPRVNRDPTSTNQLELAADAGLQPEEILYWNAIPWFREAGATTVSGAEIREGARWLVALLALLAPGTRVVALGDAARRCCAEAGLIEGERWRGGRSPGNRGLNTPPRRGVPPPPGGWRRVHWDEIVDALRWAARTSPPSSG